MIINIDFDGTCVSHEFPYIGKNIGAQRVLKKLVDNGHKLILFTMRSNRKVLNDTLDTDILDVTGNFLDDAVYWFKKNDIALFGIQTNPTQTAWTTSPKSYAEIMIDDSAIGCPLKFDPEISNRPFVDWDEVEKLLDKMELFKT